MTWLDGPGPGTARAVHTAVGLASLCAWLSLAFQVDVLIGEHGLLPAADVQAHLSALDVSLLEAPTFVRFTADPGALHTGIALGVALCLGAVFLGRVARVALALQALLYLSYIHACDELFAFQWDSLLVETGVLVAWLPRDRAAPGAHLAVRGLLFKVYFLSGIAKASSHLGDWWDGSAMAHYYETAPLPTALGWYAHQLPTAWHTVESWLALLLELVLPLAFFGPRRARLGACAALTGFQLVNLATANYGFFVYLTLALHVALLDDADVRALLDGSRRAIARTLIGVAPRAALPTETPRAPRRLGRVAFAIYGGIWALCSLATAAVHLGGPDEAALVPFVRLYDPLRLANAYHLFGSITTERLEPTFETADEAGVWTEQSLWHKPGDPLRAPDLVAPHQPRVDFRLWFYGLSPARPPAYVTALIEHLCASPASVQPLFRARLPRQPAAVRVVFHRYTFASPRVHAESGAWWERTVRGTGLEQSCSARRP